LSYFGENSILAAKEGFVKNFHRFFADKFKRKYALHKKIAL